MDFLGIKIDCKPEFSEILIAEFAEIGFESFVETDTGLVAFISEFEFQDDLFNEVIERYRQSTSIVYSKDVVERKNWNEEWEKQYDPIVVEDLCLIKAPFHQIDKKYPFEILIQPKMSFGTGHHDTTYLMIQALISQTLTEKNVLDIGCGTGILALLALKYGAASATALDLDPWSVENTSENAALNELDDVQIIEGTVQQVEKSQQFELIFANINRNVILDEINLYSSHLKEGGNVFCSGFYEKDAVAVEKAARNWQLEVIYRKVRNQWICIGFKK